MTIPAYIRLHQRELRSISKGYAWRYKMDPDEVHQELMLRLINSQHTYINDTGLETFTAWAARICMNICVDMWRRPRNAKRAHIAVPLEWAIAAHSDLRTDAIVARQHLARIFWFIRRRWPKRRLYSHVAYAIAYGAKYEEVADAHRGQSRNSQDPPP